MPLEPPDALDSLDARSLPFEVAPVSFVFGATCDEEPVEATTSLCSALWAALVSLPPASLNSKGDPPPSVEQAGRYTLNSVNVSRFILV